MSALGRGSPMMRQQPTAIVGTPQWPPLQNYMQPGAGASTSAARAGCPITVSATPSLPHNSTVAQMKQEFTLFMLTLNRLDSHTQIPDTMFTALEVITSAANIALKLRTEH